MRLRLLAVATVFVLMSCAAAPSLAQDASPATGAGIQAVLLAEVESRDLPPAPAFLGLARFRFPAGSATPAGADPGSVLVVVETGNFVAILKSPAVVQRGDVSGAPEPVAGDGETPLQPGDAVYVPAGTSTSFRNSGSSEASLLAVMIFPDDPFGPLAETSIDGVAVDLLGGGMVDTLPPQAMIALGRATFGPGADLPPSPAEGPAVGVLTSGTLIYSVIAGESAISHGAQRVGSGRPPAEPAALDVDISLSPGDAFVEEIGTVSSMRNTSDADAEFLIVFLLAEVTAAGVATPGAATTPVS